MIYGRNPYYIWSDGEVLNFDYKGEVPERIVNAFLYKILLTNRRGELAERLREGKDVWCDIERNVKEEMESIRAANKDVASRAAKIAKLSGKDESGVRKMLTINSNEADVRLEAQAYADWCEEHEDEILRALMKTTNSSDAHNEVKNA